MAEAAVADAGTTTTSSTATTGTVDNTPFHSSWIGQDGSLNSQAYSKLPEDIRHLGDSLSKYKTAEEFLRGHSHLQHLAGQKSLIPLPANASPEAIAQRKQILDGLNGVPKEAKDYGITKPKDLPDDRWDQGLADSFAQWAHKYSVSPSAAKELLSLQMGSVTKQQQALEAHRDQFFSEQAKAWEGIVSKEGLKPAQADELVNRGAAALRLDPNNEQHQALLKNAAVRTACLVHALQTGGDQFVAGEAKDGGSSSPMQEAHSIMHDKANPLYEPLYDPGHAQHRQAKEKVDSLLRQAAQQRGGR